LNAIAQPTFTNPTSNPITGITNNGATFPVTISSDGGFSITARGVCWDTNSNPTIALSTKTVNGTGIGTFTANINGLLANTKYYVRAYATSSNGTFYGVEWSFTTSNTSSLFIYGSGVTDIDGNFYNSIIINGQEWMTENLRTTAYANGDTIANIPNATQWNNLTSGAWIHYKNDSQYENPYGKLYNWFAVTDPRNVCPTGWHAPSDSEWTVLSDYLGGEFLAGGKMKSTGLQYWLSPNINATNESGFSGLPGGYCVSSAACYTMVTTGYWWSSTEYSTNNGWFRDLIYNLSRLRRDGGSKKFGLSVRCLKD